MLEGQLATIAVDGNSHYTDQQIKRHFQPLLNKAVDLNSLEDAILRLNDYPGLNATTLFMPGEQMGSTTLMVKVVEESSYDMQLFLDNYGSEYTGEYRVGAAAQNQ